jgi:exonuclease VII small subunit
MITTSDARLLELLKRCIELWEETEALLAQAQLQIDRARVRQWKQDTADEEDEA